MPIQSFRDRLPAGLAQKIGGTGEGVIAVVRLSGVIANEGGLPNPGLINAHGLEAQLTKAFGLDGLRAVALAINSPGGSPAQSELIGARIRELAEEKSVPVLAFCEDYAASGGYWIACAADEIYVAGTSMIGSIGVISSGFGFTGLIDRIGVERRVHTQGRAKARLDPFRPEAAEDRDWLQERQGQIHSEFKAWVTARRGERLRLEQHPDLFDGEVWVGRQAVERGLADGVGLLRSTLKERYPEAKIVAATAPKTLAQRLGIPIAAAVSGSLDMVVGRSLQRLGVSSPAGVWPEARGL